jgi:hypothetical protein
MSLKPACPYFHVRAVHVVGDGAALVCGDNQNRDPSIGVMVRVIEGHNVAACAKNEQSKEKQWRNHRWFI